MAKYRVRFARKAFAYKDTIFNRYTKSKNFIIFILQNSWVVCSLNFATQIICRAFPCKMQSLWDGKMGYPQAVHVYDKWELKVAEWIDWKVVSLTKF